MAEAITFEEQSAWSIARLRRVMIEEIEALMSVRMQARGFACGRTPVTQAELHQLNVEAAEAAAVLNLEPRASVSVAALDPTTLKTTVLLYARQNLMDSTGGNHG